ncbi:MAG: 4Fe-4S dicluster domain-containing protein [Candidatus Bathyarchaeia archaeon]
MHKAFIDPEKCGHCVECEAAKICPYKAINRIDSNEPSVVDATYCRGCGDCVAECNFSAIILKTA